MGVKVTMTYSDSDDGDFIESHTTEDKDEDGAGVAIAYCMDAVMPRPFLAIADAVVTLFEQRASSGLGTARTNEAIMRMRDAAESVMEAYNKQDAEFEEMLNGRGQR